MMEIPESRRDVPSVNPVIECLKLSKLYQSNNSSVQALHEINLKVGTGEFVCIVGKNGSGKSTLLSIIGAMVRPTSGKVFFNAQDLGAMPERQLTHFRSRQAGFIFQDFNLLKGYTVFENIELAAIQSAYSAHQRKDRIKSLLQRLKIADRAHHYPVELSAGEQQRAAIARALVNDPAVIFADEPTAEVDPAVAQEITDLLVDLNKTEGKTIILTTHGTFEYQAATRCCFIGKGKLISRDEAGY